MRTASTILVMIAFATGLASQNYVLQLNNQAVGDYVMQFDGDSAYVDLDSSVGNGIRSIELRFKINSPFTPSSPDGMTLIARNSVAEEGEFHLLLSAFSGTEGRMIFARRIGPTLYQITADQNTWNADQWYHIAAVIDPVSGMHLYVDGVLQADANSATAPTDSRSEITAIGRWGDLATRHLEGYIDEVRLWTRALNQVEISTNLCTLHNPQQAFNLSAYWKFDDGSGTVGADSSGNGNLAVLHGAVYLQESCLSGQAHVDLGSSVGNGIRSIEMWFKIRSPFTSSSSEGMTLIARNSGVGELGEFHLLLSAFPGSSGHLIFARRIGATLHQVNSDQNVWSANGWYHVAAVIDPVGGMWLYVDGVKQNDSALSTEPTDFRSETTTLGRWGDLSIRYLDGFIDEVRIWSRPLDQSEIVQNSCSLVDPAQDSGLIAYWRFNEGSGSVGVDESGNGNSATLVEVSYLQETYCNQTTIASPEAQMQVVFPNPVHRSGVIRLPVRSNQLGAYCIIDGSGSSVVRGRYEGSLLNLEPFQLASGIYAFVVEIEPGLFDLVKVVLL